MKLGFVALLLYTFIHSVDTPFLSGEVGWAVSSQLLLAIDILFNLLNVGLGTRYIISVMDYIGSCTLDLYAINRL